jgi:hypothetical protein
MHLNHIKIFKMLDQNNVTFQGFKFSINNENEIHIYDPKKKEFNTSILTKPN